MVNSDPNSPTVVKILNPYDTYARESTGSKDISNGDRIEISPKCKLGVYLAMLLMNSFAELVSKVGGGILAIDYGDLFGFCDSVRGIANHKYIPQDQLLEFPGQADLSAYVNFLALAQSLQGINNSKKEIMI